MRNLLRAHVVRAVCTGAAQERGEISAQHAKKGIQVRTTTQRMLLQDVLL
jgi:hypothetical protein